ncbi:MAG: phosphoenolpyruvate synthase [Spiribacter sp.]|nr:phosphoenolpyruvate synthase [Spiribacter sp.]
MSEYVVWFESLGMNDVERVGGKNASLGEMIANLADAGVQVPGGFATTADAYWVFLDESGLRARIEAALEGLDVEDVRQLAETGARIRQMIVETPFPASLHEQIAEAWEQLLTRAGKQDLSVAVRSSATAEDLPDASFAGQQETFLNVRGLDSVLHHIREVFASLFNDRAISYRVHHGFAHEQVALSAGIQEMVRSDTGASGVMFTMDTESGFRDVVFVTASYGLGETVVQGSVNPDEFYVHKSTLDAGRPAVLRRMIGEKAIKMVYATDPNATETVEIVQTDEADRMRFCLSDQEVEALAAQAMIIERHYGRPMDIEWGKDGETGRLFILQARPETVKSRDVGQSLQRYQLHERGEVLVEGRAIGQRIGAGKARVVDSIDDMYQVEAGDVLITDMTDPDWEPIMKRAAAIVTNRGGRTCHAAIIARELGIPAVVGTGDATEHVSDGTEVTVSCAEGDTGYIYRGLKDFEIREVALGDMPALPFKIMMNVGNPDRAFDFAQLPNAGVGLARLEFIINRMIGIHPRALLEFEQQPDDLKAVIRNQIAGYDDPVGFYIEKLTEGISTLAASFPDKPVIVRMSDFKSNEYANLIGGAAYEPEEENPMIGFRGASRYVSEDFRPCFELECEALRRVRDVMGFTNVWIMIPFVRTPAEGRQVVDLLAAQGLEKGKDGLKVIMMCELPSNAVLADEFLDIFDGYSIGSNDLTQLTLGLDRDSGLIAHLFEERDPAVKALLHMAIQAARRKGKYVGICGQGPSDHPDLARWLMDEGIESVSLNPDSVVETWLYLGKEHADA